MHNNKMPGFVGVDHVGLTIPDLEEAVRFYTEVTGGVERYRLGPFDATELPPMADGRDWTEAHVDVPGARLRFALIEIGTAFALELFEYERPKDKRGEPPRNCDVGGHHIALRVEDLSAAADFLGERNVQLMEPIEIHEGPAAGQKTLYVSDPWGNQLELVEYENQPRV